MKLKTFIEKALRDLSGLQGGVVHFDVSVYPDGETGVNVDRSGEQGLSRIKFDVKIEKPKLEEGMPGIRKPGDE